MLSLMMLSDLVIVVSALIICMATFQSTDTNSVGFAMLENGLQFGNNGDDPERLTADLMDAKGGLAWPIATYTYAIIRDGQDYDRLRSGATCEHVGATMQFLDWFYTSSLAKQLAARNDFVALPELVRPMMNPAFVLRLHPTASYCGQSDVYVLSHIMLTCCPPRCRLLPLWWRS